jgi:hypothetical protein
MLSKFAVALKLAAMSFLMASASTTTLAGEPGTVVLGMGGGSLKDVLFNNDTVADATFSFSARIDKRGRLKGSVFIKRVYPGNTYGADRAGTRALVSTEITLIDFGESPCPWVYMEGVATLHHTWGPKPGPGNPFLIEVRDCDSVGEGPDEVLFQVWKPGNVIGDFVTENCCRPAISLNDFTELTGGHINVLNEGFPH